ncbi:MAG: alanine racemase [SAR202 cluster bacterium]|nr:alanine racemase [SAR202 cluster bacterium]|tara:strand:- start:2214 stop:3308 length:1095 start_codon:yes stop_codon:yes gene_type:complete
MDNYRPLPGTLLEDLDTPSLIVDLDALDYNLQSVSDLYKDTDCKMRQHTKNIKSPRLALRQINKGGTVGGVCTAKLSEAEVMVEGGVNDVLIPNQVVHSDKISRMCALARQADIKVCVDNIENVKMISSIASKNSVEIGILIEVDTQMGRAGVRSNEEGVAIAKLTQDLPGVKFKGVMSHQSLPEFIDQEDRWQVGRDTIQICLDVKNAIEQEGIPVEIVSSGETFTIDVATDIPGVTEVEGGSYALMGHTYDYMGYKLANKILTTVISNPSDCKFIGDVGTLAHSWTGFGPTVYSRPDVKVDKFRENHVVFTTDKSDSLAIGDKLLLEPHYQDMLVNRWDQYICIRNGIVEEVWDIPGRGCTQ